MPADAHTNMWIKGVLAFFFSTSSAEQSHGSQFSIVLHRVFLIFRAGRASVNCQKHQNELGKIFRMLYSRGRTFVNGKKAALPSLSCLNQDKETCENREEEIASVKRTEKWSKWTFQFPKLPRGCVRCVCHIYGLPESINSNDGWKYFSESTFHLTNWWTNSLPTGAVFRSMCFSHPSMSVV